MALRFIRDFVLITLPFIAMSTFFFLGHLKGFGVFFALIALATLVYIWPRAPKVLPKPSAADEEESDPDAAGVGQVGGPL